MPVSAVLDTAIGLVFVFLTGSLICSGVIEWVSNKLNMRGAYLLRGLREALDVPPATPGAPKAAGDVAGTGRGQGLDGRENRRGELQRMSQLGAAMPGALQATGPNSYQLPAPLADLVLAHPLVATLHRPAAPGRPDGRMYLASYLSGRTFSRVFIDLLVPNGADKTTIDELTAQVQKLDPGTPARAVVLALLRNTEGRVEHFRQGLEQWYDEQMGRVSGWYKRWAQWRLFLAGIVLAVLVNVDTVGVGRTLYRDEPVRDAVVAQAVSAQDCPLTAGPDRDRCLARQRAVLRALPLPIGWNTARAAAACRM